MKSAVLILVVVLVVILFRRLRSSPTAPRTAVSISRTSAGAAASPRAASRYHSVSVKCGPGACDQALALGKRRFLPGQVGKLPLEGCTAKECRCKFVHYPDRRAADGDKRAPTALRSELYAASGKPERRSRAGRRKSDLDH